MPERDPRWERVTARVGTPFGWIDDGTGHEAAWQSYIEFLIEVQLETEIVYGKICIHKDELEDAKLNIFKFTLDKMVEQIDNHIDELGVPK